MAISLKAKLSAAFVAITVTVTLIAGILVDRNVASTTIAGFQDRLSYETTMLGQMTANALFGEIDPSDTSLKESVRALGTAVHTELAVISKDGTVVADSENEDTKALGSQSDVPEIVAARASGKGNAIRAGRMFVAASIVRDGAILGFARSAVPMSEVSAELVGVRTRMAAGSAIALVLAVGMGLFFSSALVRPIRALSSGARRVGAGDFEHVIRVSTSDEIGELAGAFNEMTKSLRRTITELDGRNRDMRLVLDNVDQGLLTIDRSGIVSPEHSAVVTKWFGVPSASESFAQYIGRTDPRAAILFELQWEELLEDTLPRELLLYQLPKRLVGGERSFELSYIPITTGNDQIAKLLIVITDITSQLAAERAEAEQREVVTMFERIMRDKSGVIDFLLEAETQVQELTGATRAPLEEIKRKLHTLKGNAGVYGMHGLAMLCHEIETHMAESEGGDLPDADRAALAQAWTRTEQRLSSFLGKADPRIVIDDEEYACVLRALLEGAPRVEVIRTIRDWKMEPAIERLDRIADQVRDLAKRLQKKVDVDVDGAGLRLPREEWATFWASFTHVVRNAVDHGLESEEERRNAGKSERGKIRLAVARTGRSIQIEIADDGRGIDWEKVAARARAASLPASRSEDLVAALFADGISTRETVSDLSGRGVGLAAAKEACERLGGYVAVESVPGRGTAFRFHLPIPDRGQSLRPAEVSIPPRLTIATAT